MRILIHSNAPWVPTGYGLQTRMLMDQLRRHGHTVAVSAFSGLGGADVKWRGYQVMPGGQMAFGIDMLIPHMQRFGPDLTITLMDLWKLEALGSALRGHNVAAWLPVDCSPPSRRDLAALAASGATPIAMSRFGEAQLAAALTEDASQSPLYAPHAIDTDAFAPMPDRLDFRREMELHDKFVIGINAANKDATRKAFPEQFAAFARHRERHPDSVLLVHSTARNVGGWDLYELAEDMQIGDATRFTEQYVLDSGLMDTEMMRRWYSALDVLSLCSYAEGFGIPLIEAQACGTPVVTTNGSAMTELVGPGWLAGADPFWNPVHRAWWQRPRVTEITKAYGQAYRADMGEEPERSGRRARARQFAVGYDADTVFENHWEPILKELLE